MGHSERLLWRTLSPRGPSLAAQFTLSCYAIHLEGREGFMINVWLCVLSVFCGWEVIYQVWDDTWLNPT